MWWEWNFTSVVFLPKPTVPTWSWQKLQKNPNLGTFYKTPDQYSWKLSRSWKMREVWETVTAKSHPRRRGNSMPCGVLDGTPKQKNIGRNWGIWIKCGLQLITLQYQYRPLVVTKVPHWCEILTIGETGWGAQEVFGLPQLFLVFLDLDAFDFEEVSLLLRFTLWSWTIGFKLCTWSRVPTEVCWVFFQEALTLVAAIWWCWLRALG